jgi:group I intron endonuclease
MIGIYKIENIINNKKYIGSAINIEIRTKRHINDLKNNKHDNIYLQREFNKYKLENFKFECIEICNKKNLKEIEQKYLDNIFSIKECNLYYYNIGRKSTGGDNISNNPDRNNIVNKIRKGLYNRYKKESEEDKLARKNKLKGENNPNYGNKWNDTQRKRMSIQRKGTSSKIKGKTFEELYGDEKAKFLKTKMSERAKNQTGKNNPNYGNKCSEHLKKYYSNLFKNKKNRNALTISKPFTIDDKNYILLTDAAKDYNVKYQTIKNRLLSNKFPNYKYIIDKNKINEMLLKYEKDFLNNQK